MKLHTTELPLNRTSGAAYPGDPTHAYERSAILRHCVMPQKLKHKLAQESYTKNEFGTLLKLITIFLNSSEAPSLNVNLLLYFNALCSSGMGFDSAIAFIAAGSCRNAAIPKSWPGASRNSPCPGHHDTTTPQQLAMHLSFHQHRMVAVDHHLTPGISQVCQVCQVRDLWGTGHFLP